MEDLRCILSSAALAEAYFSFLIHPGAVDQRGRSSGLSCEWYKTASILSWAEYIGQRNLEVVLLWSLVREQWLGHQMILQGFQLTAAAVWLDRRQASQPNPTYRHKTLMKSDAKYNISSTFCKMFSEAAALNAERSQICFTESAMKWGIIMKLPFMCLFHSSFSLSLTPKREVREIWLFFSGPVAPRLAGKSAANANETKQSKQLQSARTKLIETEHYTQSCLVKAVTLRVHFFKFSFFILFFFCYCWGVFLREHFWENSLRVMFFLQYLFFFVSGIKVCGELFWRMDSLMSLVLKLSNSGVFVL